MKNNLYLIIIFVFLFTACGPLEPQLPVTPSVPVKPITAFVPPEQKKETVKKFVYRGSIYRDPFDQITAEKAATTGQGIQVPTLGSLSLTGIMRYGNQEIALLTAGSNSYMLMNGRIYDSRQRLIKKMSGIINEDNVVITAPDRSKKKLTLRTDVAQ